MSLAVAVDRASQLEDVPLLVDLSAVTFMDASTVGAIFGSRNRPRSRAQALGVRAPSPSALRVIELCGLAHLVHREPLRAIGVAGALATWVDVPAIQPSVGADDGSGPVPAGQESRQPLGVLAAAGARSDHATVPLEADSGGP